MRSLSSSSCLGPRLSRSISSSKPSSRICRKISSSIVSASDDRLNSDRRLDWCSIRRVRSESPGRNVRCRTSSSRRRLDRPSSCLSVCPLLSLVRDECPAVRRVSRLACARLSRILSSRTSCNKRLSSSSSSSALSPPEGTAGNTDSPCVYRWAISAFSSVDLARLGCAPSTISRSVVTVAFGRVPRTSARHEGQVNRGEGRREAWALNHSFTQEPQKVWRQSRRVRGW
jgi:hypothetical protein